MRASHLHRGHPEPVQQIVLPILKNGKYIIYLCVWARQGNAPQFVVLYTFDICAAAVVGIEIRVRRAHCWKHDPVRGGAILFTREKSQMCKARVQLSEKMLVPVLSCGFCARNKQRDMFVCNILSIQYIIIFQITYMYFWTHLF